MQRWIVTTNNAGKRLDVFIVERLPRLSRAFASRLIDDGKANVNGKQAKAGQKLRAGEQLILEYDLSELDHIPVIKLPIIYEDEDCVVVNKPVGLLAHSKGAFNPEATVATWLRNHLQNFNGERAGIVHRLDRATSGVMICAKSPTALSWLQKQFSQRKTIKSYMAVVSGQLEPAEAIIDMPIERNPKAPATFRVGANGKASTTHYRVVQMSEQHSLLELKPATGRTHQLRVHLKQLKHPIVGDTLYGGESAERLFLHAMSLEITLPNRERKTFTATVPSEFAHLMKQVL